MKRLTRNPAWLVAIFVLVYALGWGLPLLVDDGTSGLSGEEQLAAFAHREARHVFWDNPLEQVWARRFQVVGIVRGTGVIEPTGGLASGWQVRVRVYTFFGLPYADAVFESNGGSVEYRLPTGPVAFLILLATPIALALRWAHAGC